MFQFSSFQSQQKFGRKLFSETSTLEISGQSALDTDMKRGDDLMSNINPLSNDQEGHSRSMSKDKLSPPVPEKNYVTLQSEQNSALWNNINFSANKQHICVDDLLDEIIEFTSIHQLHSPIPNSPIQDIAMEDSPEQFIELLSRDKPVSLNPSAPIDNTLKVRESVQGLAQEVCALASIGKAISVNRSISTPVMPRVLVKIDLNLLVGMLCIDKQSPHILNPFVIPKKVIDTFNPENSALYQCLSEKTMENSGRDEINENLVSEQNALKLESVPNFQKAVLSQSDIVTKKRKLSITQYKEAVKRKKISLESRPRDPCTDLPKM